MNTQSSQSTLAQSANAKRAAPSRRKHFACKSLCVSIALLTCAAAPLPLLAAAAPPAPAGFSRLLESVGTGSPGSEQNYRALLPSLFSVANARPLEAAYRPIRKTMTELSAALGGSGSPRFVAQSSTQSKTVFACPQGGSASASAMTPSYGGKPTITASFKACRVDNQRLDGVVQWNANYGESALFGPAAGNSARAPFAFMDTSGMVTRIDGYRGTPRTPGDNYRQLDWTAGWSLQAGNKKLTVERMSLSTLNQGDGSLSYTSDFAMSGNLTNGKRVSVSTFAPFTSQGGPTFTDGYMQVLSLNSATSADNLMAITAASDLGETFNIKLDTYAQGQGVVSTLLKNIPQSFGGGLLKMPAR